MATAGPDFAFDPREPLESRLRATLDVIPAYAWYANPSGGLAFVNERQGNYLGLPKDHPLRFGIEANAAWDSHITLLHPDDHKEARRVWSTCLRTGSAGEVTFRVRNAEGQYRWFLSRAEPLRSSDGTLLHWVGVNLEIEERKQAEFYLAEGQRLAHMGSWAINSAGFDYWSPELFKIYGLDPSGKPPTVEEYLALVHPEDRGFMRQSIRAMFRDHHGFDFTKRFVRSDGRVRRVRCVGVPRAHGETFLGFVGTGMDVTEQEELTEELRRSGFYLAEGERLAHIGSWVFNPAGFFDYWSRELFRIYGLDPAQKAPSLEEYISLVHPQDQEFMESLIRRMMAEASGCDVTKRIVRPNGEVRYIRCVGASVVEDGVLQRIIGTAIDVTDHELLTQELRLREAYLAEAQRLSHTGSYGWNISSGNIVWSTETYRIFEFPPSSRVSLQMILQRVHPQDRSSVETAIAAAANREGIDLEYRLLMPEGRVKYLHVVGKTDKCADGSIEVVAAVMDVTARKQTEVQLRRSKAQLANAQTLSHTGSVGMEVSTKRIFWSEESARIYGFAPGTEPTPDLILRRVHPDDVDLLRDVLDRAAQGGSGFDFEHRLLMPDGSIKHVYNLAHCFRDEAGNEEILGTIIDITGRRTAEQAIREREVELQQMLDFTPQLVAVFGPNRERLYVNRIALDYLGITLEEWRQMSFAAEVHPDDSERLTANVDRALSDGSAYELEVRLRKADGSYRWFLARYNPVLDDKGQIIRWYVACTDIEDRKQAEDRLRQENIALKRAEEKIRQQDVELRQMLDFVPQLVSVFGPDHERIYANRMGLDYLGISLEEWRQTRDMRVFVHPDDGDRMRAFFDRALSIGSAYQLEYRVRKNDGSYRWFLARYNPVHDELGRVARWYVAFTDIDDRKRAEERLREENAALREEIDKASMFEEIVGTSPALATVLGHISKVAPSDSTVLITGETGTGKELVARAIHRRSVRASRPFVSVNCAAIPRDLVASELFGHEKGAFTGATQQRAGRFELASGGTIFLDEVGELPAETQIALLRVLQEREFERVGGTRSVRADVRVIAATNRDLQSAVRAGSFRSDLYYRLNVFPIENPPLRDRRADIPLLVEYFIDRYARKAGKHITRVNKKTLDLLQSYAWPGNIRELQNVIERCIILCDSETFSIDESWLPHHSVSKEPINQIELNPRLQEQEKKLIEAALQESRGRVFGPHGAAAKLGIPRSTLESKIKSLKIDKNRYKPSSEI